MSIAVGAVQPAWGGKVDAGAAAEARAAAVAAGRTSYTVKRASGTGQPHTFFITGAAVPVLMDRVVDPIKGPRNEARPSFIAYREEERHGADVAVSGPFGGAPADWATDEPMPDECHELDSGWLPGPVPRNKPVFAGPTPGPTDPSLNEKSSAKEIMARLLTDQICDAIADFGKQHAVYYRQKLGVYTKEELAKLDDTIESAMDFDYSKLSGDSVRLWLAAKLRVARLSAAVNEQVLWDDTHSLYDKLLDRKLPYTAYQWFNRHMSFSQYNGDSDEQEYDRYRKRRFVTNLVNEILPKVYNAHQDLGVDEKVC